MGIILIILSFILGTNISVSKDVKSMLISTYNTEKVQSVDIKRSNNLVLNCNLQTPELPTGCEVTSLSSYLGYLGINVDKCDLADNFLDKVDIENGDFYNYFVGNPRKVNSYGCYANALCNTANKYLSYIGDSRKAVNKTGLEFTDLFYYINNNKPVIVWSTIDCVDTNENRTWSVNGQSITWLQPMHCVILTGYDLDSNIVYISDPLSGNITRDLSRFESTYNQLYKQAIIIE